MVIILEKWYTKNIEEIYTKLKTSNLGLSDKEASLRLKKDGYN